MLGPVLHAAVIVTGELSAAPVVAAMAFGLTMALAGHIARNNAVVGLGIAVLFLATAAMVLLAYQDYSSGTSLDPRPRDRGLPPQVYE